MFSFMGFRCVSLLLFANFIDEVQQVLQRYSLSRPMIGLVQAYFQHGHNFILSKKEGRDHCNKGIRYPSKQVYLSLPERQEIDIRP
jgi:hypothetical protein